jgi:hypothetical protein
MPRHGLVVLSLLLGLTACEEGKPTAPSDDNPMFGTGNGPAEPGHSLVVRSNDGIFLTSVDEVNGLVVRHYNTENIDFCGGTDTPPTAEAQAVFLPGAVIYTWKTGVIPVYVYRLSEVPPQEASPQLCNDLKTKWLYKGTHTLTNHDNDVFFEPGRTNAFGWIGQGSVVDRAGRGYRYSESFQAAITPVPAPPPEDVIGIERNVRYSLSIR